MLNKLKPKSEFSKNVLTLMTGTTIAQAIPIATSPILTRIYTPEDFGILALYIGVVSIIAVIATARYEMAIVLPESDEEAINILGLSLLIMFSIVLLSSLAIVVFKEEILRVLNIEEIGTLVYLVPVSIFLAGLYQSLNYWTNRKKYFSKMATVQVSQSIGSSFGQVGFGSLSLHGGLILGNILGYFLAVFILLKQFIKKDIRLTKNISKAKMYQQMIKHKDFPLINSFHAFSDIIRTSGSVMLISSFYGATILGFYALSLRVLQIPIGIIGSALGQVLYQKFTVLHNAQENLYPYVRAIVLKLLLVAVPIFSLLYIVLPDLFSFVFGENWRIAGEYGRVLVPYLLMNFLISPISSIPLIIGKQKEMFYISLFGNVLYLLVFIFFASLDILEVLFILSATQFAFYVYVSYWYYKTLRNYVAKC